MYFAAIDVNYLCWGFSKDAQRQTRITVGGLWTPKKKVSIEIEANLFANIYVPALCELQ